MKHLSENVGGDSIWNCCFLPLLASIIWYCGHYVAACVPNYPPANILTAIAFGFFGAFSTIKLWKQ